MEINGKNPLEGLSTSVHRLEAPQQNQRATKTEEERPQSASDRIELSIQSREIQHLDEWIRSTPDIREAKVEQLRTDIQRGAYNRKAEEIVPKLLGDLDMIV